MKIWTHGIVAEDENKQIVHWRVYETAPDDKVMRAFIRELKSLGLTGTVRMARPEEFHVFRQI